MREYESVLIPKDFPMSSRLDLIKRKRDSTIRNDARRVKTSVQLSNQSYERKMSTISWLSAENKCVIPDVRDHMYINTYCSDERPLRYNEITLPRISKGRHLKSRRDTETYENTSREKVFLRNMKTYNGWTTANSRRTQKPDNTYVNPGLLPLCEIRRIEIMEQTRNPTDGKLYGRNIPNDNMLFRHRPLPAEHGRYRPFSTIVVKIPQASSEAQHSPKICISAEQYMKYVENKALQIKVQETQRYFNSKFSKYRDFDNQAVQYVMSVNRPQSACKTSSSADLLKKGNEKIESTEYEESVSSISSHQRGVYDIE